jgi:nickel/cobalt exporter
MARARWPRRSSGAAAEPADDHGPPHDHGHGPHGHRHDPETEEHHLHGWGPRHSHRLDAVTVGRPSWLLLLGLGAAGGLLPDPAALAVMLAAIASGRLVLGVLTVIVFSIGFASVLVLVGLVAARLGEAVLGWLSGRRVVWFQFGTALVVTCVGAALTVGAWQALGAWP